MGIVLAGDAWSSLWIRLTIALKVRRGCPVLDSDRVSDLLPNMGDLQQFPGTLLCWSEKASKQRESVAEGLGGLDRPFSSP